jgi:glyoxylate/hydroxypyruvate reductase
MAAVRSILLAGDLGPQEWEQYASILRIELQALGLGDAFEVFTQVQIDRLENAAYVYAQIEVAIVAKPPDALWPKLSGLKWVQSLWAGVEKLLASPTLPAGIQLTRMVDPFMTQTMAEAVCTHVLWLHRQMHRYAALQRQGRWEQLDQGPAQRCQVGIVGFGELGQACGQALSALGFSVSGYRRTSPAVNVYTDAPGLSKLLEQSDIVINLLPLTQSTTGFFNAQCFAQFKPNSSFVNLARGDHVDESALKQALGAHLEHAILDVFSIEPLPTSHWLWSHPQVTITPHVAADSRPETIFKVVADNARRYVLGQPLQFNVERSRGY